jgi:hypothetical protein
MPVATLIRYRAVRPRERMNSPLEHRKVRLRGLGGPAMCGAPSTCASAIRRSPNQIHNSPQLPHEVRLREPEDPAVRPVPAAWLDQPPPGVLGELRASASGGGARAAPPAAPRCETWLMALPAAGLPARESVRRRAWLLPRGSPAASHRNRRSAPGFPRSDPPRPHVLKMAPPSRCGVMTITERVSHPRHVRRLCCGGRNAGETAGNRRRGKAGTPSLRGRRRRAGKRGGTSGSHVRSSREKSS